MLTQERVKELFDYRDGVLYWRVRLSNCVHIGDAAGCLGPNGYMYVRVEGTLYLNHRLIYLYHKGESPERLDHKDTNTQNNRIENLRPATAQQNAFNTKTSRSNTSGAKGVCWYKQYNMWSARINGANGKHIGYFADKESAIAAIREARETMHKEFCNHG